jgi:uncharacterized protein (TIGR03437 family)
MIGALAGAFAAILTLGQVPLRSGQQANGGRPTRSTSRAAPLTLLPQFVEAGLQPQRGASVLPSPPVVPPLVGTFAANLQQRRPACRTDRWRFPPCHLRKEHGTGDGVDSDFPLQTELGGVSVQIRSGDVTTAGLMLRASWDFVSALVPSATPLGDATVTVTYRGRSTAPLPIRIVSTSVGIRTRNQQGSGAAIAYHAPPGTMLSPGITFSSPNTLSQAAKPGQLVAMQATGFGPVTFDETQNLSQDLDVAAEVIVGNLPATVMGKLRFATGQDVILFQVPENVPEGCYVPVVVRAGGVTSNVASISIASSGGACSDPGGLSASDIEAAQKAGQFNFGMVFLQHLEFDQLGVDELASGTFGRYDFNSLLKAASGTPDGIRDWRDSAAGHVHGYAGLAHQAQRPVRCLSTRPVRRVERRDGANLSGPSGSRRWRRLSTDSIRTRRSSPRAITRSITDGDAGGGRSRAHAAADLDLTNADSLGSIPATTTPRSRSGGVPDKEYVMIAGLSSSKPVSAAFFCTENVAAAVHGARLGALEAAGDGPVPARGPDASGRPSGLGHGAVHQRGPLHGDRFGFRRCYVRADEVPDRVVPVGRCGADAPPG